MTFSVFSRTPWQSSWKTAWRQNWTISCGFSRHDYKNKDSSHNGHSNKTLRISFGDVEVSALWNWKGEFFPQLLKKNQTSISQDIEEKILSMYAKGMTTGDIEAYIRDNLWGRGL